MHLARADRARMLLEEARDARDPSKQDYLDLLQVAIQHLHACGAIHGQTVPVHDVFRGKTVWQGEVEVFDLEGGAKANRCYASIHGEGPNDEASDSLRCLKSLRLSQRKPP